MEILKITGCCPRTISKYCKKAGLSENLKKVNSITPELLEEIQQKYNKVKNLKLVGKEYHISSAGLREAGLQVVHPLKDYSERKVTPQASCAQKTKLKAIHYKGGKCLICGYNKSIRALSFHHLDPSLKDFGISDGTRFFEKIKPELDKCILVCANCHAEIHEGITEVSEDIEIIKNEDSIVEESNKNKTICPVCGNGFSSVNGKIYCSKECREKARNLPTKEELFELCKILGTWLKVKQHYKIGDKTLQEIRNS